MSFKTGEPIPEILRNSLNEVLEKRDYLKISIEEKTASETMIENLLNGSKIIDADMDIVYEIIRHGMAKCDERVNLYTRLKNIINIYNTKPVEARP